MLLVYTHVVCERLSAMQEQARLPEFLVQNSLSAPTQVFQECWSGLQPPPLENKKLARTWHMGFELVWSTPTLNENLARLRDFGSELVWSRPPHKDTISFKYY